MPCFLNTNFPKGGFLPSLQWFYWTDVLLWKWHLSESCVEGPTPQLLASKLTKPSLMI